MFIRKHHRHHRPHVSDIFRLGAAVGESVIGCAVMGRPMARALCDGWTLEVVRLCILDDAPRNSHSWLLAKSWKAAQALGYRKLITYTLPEEGGASLRGAGWRCVGQAGGGSWSCPSRPRVDKHPLQVKMKWEKP
jgi:hypothetical protein